jgi:NAD(P)-dependent dehydrogenase (short-subunit alcohol dehydrogenase family)
MNVAAASGPGRKSPVAGKAVLVTGASSGIGKAAAELLALRGARGAGAAGGAEGWQAEADRRGS